jgi:hypothetical protein
MRSNYDLPSLKTSGAGVCEWGATLQQDVKRHNFRLSYITFGPIIKKHIIKS